VSFNKHVSLQNKLKNIERKVENQKVEITKLLENKKTSKESIRKLHDEKKLFNNYMLSATQQIQALTISAKKAEKQISDLWSFKTEIKELLECPISLDMIKRPVFTPSGYTVDQSVMENMVKNKQIDPFTRKGRCCKFVQNHLAKQVIDILRKFE
jgi:uncharacterized protein YktA (UPF0223 family)